MTQTTDIFGSIESGSKELGVFKWATSDEYELLLHYLKKHLDYTTDPNRDIYYGNDYLNDIASLIGLDVSDLKSIFGEVFLVVLDNILDADVVLKKTLQYLARFTKQERFSTIKSIALVYAALVWCRLERREIRLF